MHIGLMTGACGGRLTRCLGLSHRPVVEEQRGLSYSGPARYMREYLSVLRPLLTEGHCDFDGEGFQVHAQLHVQESTPCPVLIAGLAPLMLRLAGEVVDGTITWMSGAKTFATI